MVNRKTIALPQQQFYLRASLVEKDEHISAERIFLQALTHQPAQPIEALAHVGLVAVQKIPAR